MDSDIRGWDLSTNFFEWGVKCSELSTNSVQVPGISPITSVTFAWNTVQPEITSSLTANTTKRTYGVGQCKFEILGSGSRCAVQDAFKSQTTLPTLELIRFINVNGQFAETEKYVFTKVFITSYSVIVDQNNGGHRDQIGISSSGEHRYIQIVRAEDGRAMGQMMSKVAAQN